MEADQQQDQPAMLKQGFLSKLFKVAQENKTWAKFPLKKVYAQSALETGNFSSDLFRLGNNAFGMTYVGQRYTNGKMGRFATYATVEDSMRDYFRRQVRFKVSLDEDKFIQSTIDSNYVVGDPDYLKKIESIEKRDFKGLEKKKVVEILQSGNQLPLFL